MMEYPDNESQRLQYVHTLLPYFQKNTTFTTKLEDLMTLLSIHYQVKNPSLLPLLSCPQAFSPFPLSLSLLF